jgi:hypothetical protein
MANRSGYLKTFAASLLSLFLAALAAGQINQQLPVMPEGALLPDIFKAADDMRERFRAIEFKETLAFRLAAILPEGKGRRNVDFRQSADYAVTVKPGQGLERKLLKSNHRPAFEEKSLLKDIDIPAIQETLPPITTLQTGLFNFVSKDYIHGYKDLGPDKVGKRQAIKMELRFRPGRMPVEQCLLWVDEKTHAPLKAEMKIGDIGRYSDVRLIISYEEGGQNSLPASIHQELACSTFERGIPLRLEHSATYTELKLLPAEK